MATCTSTRLRNFCFEDGGSYHKVLSSGLSLCFGRREVGRWGHDFRVNLTLTWNDGTTTSGTYSPLEVLPVSGPRYRIRPDLEDSRLAKGGTFSNGDDFYEPVSQTDALYKSAYEYLATTKLKFPKAHLLRIIRWFIGRILLDAGWNCCKPSIIHHWDRIADTVATFCSADKKIPLMVGQRGLALAAERTLSSSSSSKVPSRFR